MGVYHKPTDGRPPVTDASAKVWVPEPTAVQAEALSQFKAILEAGGGAVDIEQDMELFRFRKVRLHASRGSTSRALTWIRTSLPFAAEHVELCLGITCLPRSGTDRRLPALARDRRAECARVLQRDQQHWPHGEPGSARRLGQAAVRGDDRLPAEGGRTQAQRPRRHPHRAAVRGRVCVPRPALSASRSSPIPAAAESSLPSFLTGTIGNVLRMGRRVGVKDEDMKVLRLVYGLCRVIQANQLKA
jgi:hypothetical protein